MMTRPPAEPDVDHFQLPSTRGRRRGHGHYGGGLQREALRRGLSLVHADVVEALRRYMLDTPGRRRRRRPAPPTGNQTMGTTCGASCGHRRRQAERRERSIGSAIATG